MSCRPTFPDCAMGTVFAQTSRQSTALLPLRSSRRSRAAHAWSRHPSLPSRAQSPEDEETMRRLLSVSAVRPSLARRTRIVPRTGLACLVRSVKICCACPSGCAGGQTFAVQAGIQTPDCLSILVGWLFICIYVCVYTHTHTHTHTGLLFAPEHKLRFSANSGRR